MTYKKYSVKGKVFTFFGEYTISDEEDQIAYTAKGNFLRTKLRIFDDMGEEVLVVRRKLFSLRYTFFIEKGGQPVFRVFKSLGFQPQIFIESLVEPDAFEVRGNIWSTEYAFYREGKEFAYVSKKIFNPGGLYGLAIAPGQSDEVVIALVLIIDMIKKIKRRRRSG